MRKLSLCLAAVATLALGACGSKSPSAIADAQAAPAPQAAAAASTVTLSQADLDKRINDGVAARLASATDTGVPQAQGTPAPAVRKVRPRPARLANNTGAIPPDPFANNPVVDDSGRRAMQCSDPSRPAVTANGGCD